MCTLYRFLLFLLCQGLAFGSETMTIVVKAENFVGLLVGWLYFCCCYCFFNPLSQYGPILGKCHLSILAISPFCHILPSLSSSSSPFLCHHYLNPQMLFLLFHKEMLLLLWLLRRRRLLQRLLLSNTNAVGICWHHTQRLQFIFRLATTTPSRRMAQSVRTERKFSMACQYFLFQPRGNGREAAGSLICCGHNKQPSTRPGHEWVCVHAMARQCNARPD